MSLPIKTLSYMNEEGTHNINDGPKTKFASGYTSGKKLS